MLHHIGLCGADVTVHVSLTVGSGDAECRLVGRQPLQPHGPSPSPWLSQALGIAGGVNGRQCRSRAAMHRTLSQALEGTGCPLQAGHAWAWDEEPAPVATPGRVPLATCHWPITWGLPHHCSLLTTGLHAWHTLCFLCVLTAGWPVAMASWAP